MWPDEASWIKALTQDMQTMRGGLEGEIAARTGLQVMAPERDQLTCQIGPVVQRHLPELTGTLLDVGCYGGWLYSVVKDKATYHGIDIWPEAVLTATRLWGPHFEVQDVKDTRGKWDVVWCTQLIHNDPEAMWGKLRSLASRLVVYASPDIKGPLPGETESYVVAPSRVAVWRASA